MASYNYQDSYKNPYNQDLTTRYKNSKIVWLNSAFSSSSVSNGNTYFSFNFDIPAFQLFNRTKLSVASYISNESNAKPIIIKIGDIMFDTDSTFNTDREGYPTLFVGHTGVASQLNNNQFSLILPPQQISRISLYLSNSFTTRNAGFSISGAGAGNFIIGLLFEDDDLV